MAAAPDYWFLFFIAGPLAELCSVESDVLANYICSLLLFTLISPVISMCYERAKPLLLPCIVLVTDG